MTKSSSFVQPRVAFIGNCQAQSLESLSGHLGLPLQVVSLPAVFELDAFGSPEIWEKIRSCDFVFNQRVAPDYPVEFARPEYLKSALGPRAISWPNIYFDGYFPGVEYVYSPTGKVVGPLSDYHLSFVREAWAQGLDVDDLVQTFLSGHLADSFRSAADKSLFQLRQRERGLTVRMSDWIAARWRYGKLLYVMNHPGNPILLELLKRLLCAANISCSLNEELLETYPYTLNDISLPAYPSLHAAYGLRFEADSQILGKGFALAAGEASITAERRTYDWGTLFADFYRLYDAVSARSPEMAQILRLPPQAG